MSRLRAYPWEVSYSTSDVRDDGTAVDLLHDFYLPVLARSVSYDRVAGYFSSSSLAAASRGFSQFVAGGGNARFIVGVDLEADDAEAIVRGDQERAAQRLDERLGNEAEWPADVARGVELLAWIVTHGYLTVKVAIRVHGDTGQAQSMGYQGDGYVHEKWAVFGDGEDALVASGSLNESRTALTLNAENLEIFTDWEGRGGERIARKRRSFESMWADRHLHIRVFDLPEATRRRLLKIAERVRAPVEVDGTGTIESPMDKQHRPTAWERLRFAAIRLAPLLPGGQFVGMETTAIRPWPHQRFVARRLIESYPENHLLCDEVGLGKTIEAGLAFRSLWLSGHVSSIRVFAPASLTSQWLHEMAEKFFLPFRRRFNREGDHDMVDPATGALTRDRSSFFGCPLEIISTGLLIHGDGAGLLTGMGATDLILLDEAHKARRHEPDQTRREPRFNNLYKAVERFLFPQARSLLLATATPMQINRVEAFDLLRFVYTSGAVRLSGDLCNAFYSLREEIIDNQSLAEYQTDFLARYLGDARRTAPAQWRLVRDYVLDLFGQGEFDNLVDYCTPPVDWPGLQPALTMLSPLGRSMLRHTRELLRVYQREGLLDSNLAQRNVEPVVIELSGDERALYDALQAYCDNLARRIGANQDDSRQRAAIGFYLSFLRLRFASSFHALACSFGRRLEKVDKTLAHHAEHETRLRSDDDAEELTEDELTGLVLKNREPADLTWEQGAVQGLLEQLRALQQTPRKTRRLLELIERRRDRASGRVRQMVIFTRYADTLRYLYDELTARLPNCPLATFSGAGGYLRSAARQAGILDRTRVRQQFVAGRIDILLCTDAAAEGLNLQSADLLVNFDLPWNPMLLEQRIGRIDRIGQAHPRITVCNFVYQDSVEEVVYIRLVQRFQDAVSVTGALQFSLLPIEEKDFQDYAKTPGEPGRIDWDTLLQRAESHRQRMDERRRLTEFAAEQQKVAYEALEREAAVQPAPVTLDEIWRAVRESPTLRALGCEVERFEQGEALSLYGLPGIAESALLTVSRKLYEHGLPDDDNRVLRFATYGDSAFEALLDYLLADEKQVQQAWAARQPLSHLETAASGHIYRFPGDACEHTVVDNPIAVCARTPEPVKADDRGQSGQRHQTLVAAAAAALAQMKLPKQPAPPARHMQRLDEFMHRRPQPRFQLPVSLQNQSDYVVNAEQLLWPVTHSGTRLTGDPILFDVCRDVIERAISAMPSDRRTNRGVADRIVGS